MDAHKIKHYPRQHHTRVTITGHNQQGQYPGHLTEVTLWGAVAGVFLEINQFRSFEAEEPFQHELLFYPAVVSVEAVERVNAEPVPHPTDQPTDGPTEPAPVPPAAGQEDPGDVMPAAAPGVH